MRARAERGIRHRGFERVDRDRDVEVRRDERVHDGNHAARFLIGRDARVPVRVGLSADVDDRRTGSDHLAGLRDGRTDAGDAFVK